MCQQAKALDCFLLVLLPPVSQYQYFSFSFFYFIYIFLIIYIMYGLWPMGYRFNIIKLYLTWYLIVGGMK